MIRIRLCFFFSSRRRHTRWPRDWSSDVCSSDLTATAVGAGRKNGETRPARLTVSHTASTTAPTRTGVSSTRRRVRSEERRVGKEWRSRGAPGEGKEKERKKKEKKRIRRKEARS